MAQNHWNYIEIGYAQHGCEKLAKHAYAKKIAIDATFDLHGLTANEGHDEIIQIIDNCVLNKHRCVLIIHGMGKDILKNIVREYCYNNPLLLACIRAPRSLGDDGATIVLIKKEKDHA